MRRITFMLSTGFLGAAALIIGERWFTPGKNILLVYTVFFIFLGLMLARGGPTTFGEQFKLALGSYALATFGLYLYIAIANRVVTRISPIGHLTRLVVLTAIGSVFCAAVAALATSRGLKMKLVDA